MALPWTLTPAPSLGARPVAVHTVISPNSSDVPDQSSVRLTCVLFSANEVVKGCSRST